MLPRSPLTGLTDLIRPVIKGLTKSLKQVNPAVLDIRKWAENRLDQAMRCPECGHGGELDPVVAYTNAHGCKCTDPLCACNPENVMDGGDPW